MLHRRPSHALPLTDEDSPPAATPHNHSTGSPATAKSPPAPGTRVTRRWRGLVTTGLLAALALSVSTKGAQVPVGFVRSVEGLARCIVQCANDSDSDPDADTDTPYDICVKECWKNHGPGSGVAVLSERPPECGDAVVDPGPLVDALAEIQKVQDTLDTAVHPDEVMDSLRVLFLRVYDDGVVREHVVDTYFVLATADLADPREYGVKWRAALREMLLELVADTRFMTRPSATGRAGVLAVASSLVSGDELNELKATITEFDLVEDVETVTEALRVFTERSDD